jgi:arylsulfatase A-like enzyme
VDKQPDYDKDDYAYTVSYNGRAGSLRTDRWRYTRWGEKTNNGNEELYDHENDPEELSNLADNPDYKTILRGMREKMDMQKAKAKNQIH